MAFLCRSSFSFYSKTHFRHFLYAKRFVSKWVGSNPPIDLSLGLLAPFPTHKTKEVMEAYFSTMEQAEKGGATYIQVWGKNTDLRDSLSHLSYIKKIVKIPVIINNCPDIALKLGFAGVHLGQKDLPYTEARRLLGPSATIGLTVHTLSDVLAVRNLDVYLGVQLFHSTHTKPPKITDPLPWGLEGAKEITAFTSQRIAYIGHITLENLSKIRKVLRHGDGVVMGGAIVRAKNPFAATKVAHSLVLEKFKNEGLYAKK